ncbi:MAG: TIGR00282 family metallophosphoesterase [Clostridia bacterium]|nr:TIGR00282 family metallophosphoesterase [Clostridia bacterium]
MNILVLGDVVSDHGCDFLMKRLPPLKKLKSVDLCIANGENSAVGNGILPGSAQSLFDCGVDVITTGNHVFRRREIYSLLDECDRLVRPANYAPSNPGKGVCTVDMGRCRVCVINLAGNYGLDVADNAFRCVERILKDVREKIIIVDFHAEATSEKRAMGFFLDGRVSAVFGTHTHVQTADEQVLPNGTGYITDVGMCGVIDSVLGVKKEIIVKKMLDNMPARFDAADGECMINGCIFEIDEKTGKCLSVERLIVK